ncbi:MAG: hypothetical protein KR126chlam3_01318 [Chlamydiae bacterium]|nr:hypothetical protein [Chlamydiota bacterium]
MFDVTKPIYSGTEAIGILGSVLKSSKTLSRTQSFYSLLPKTVKLRQGSLQSVLDVCSKTLESLANPSIEVSPSAITDKLLMELDDQVADGLGDIYDSVFSDCETIEKVKKGIRRIIKDVEAVRVSPARKSCRGNKGPTLLVSYPKICTDPKRIIHWNSGVIKWTNWTEIVCNSLYNFFSQSFAVPPGIALDLPNKIIVQILEEKSESIDLETCKEIEKIFSRLKAGFVSRDQDKEIMISERIEGEHLFDFAQSKYPALSQSQKESLFINLAKIAVLDLIFGNLDRFARVEFNAKEEKYALSELEANLGNAMVKWNHGSKQDLQVFSIDNGIDHIDMPLRQQKYITFLQGLFESPDFPETIAQNMVSNFVNALNNQVDDYDGNVHEIKKKLEMFSTEITSIGKAAFQRGIREAIAQLPASISKWDDSEGDHLRDYLRKHSPQVLEIIQKRIQGFASIKTKTQVDG